MARLCTGCGYVSGSNPDGPPEACNDNGLVGPHRFVDVPDDETPFCGRHHSLDDHAAYIVVYTRLGHGRDHDVEIFNAREYGKAVDLKRDLVIAAPDGYAARLDVLYADGCRRIL